MKRFWASILAGFLGCGAMTQAVQAQSGPVNPNATPEARALLAYLNSISGTATITGQHNFPNDSSRWTDLAYDLTGKYPGLFGQDFGFSAGDDKDSVLSRPAMIEEVKRQYANGAVVTLTWHEVRPTDDEPVTFHESVQGHLTDYEWQQLLTPGTPLYNRWCAQVDVAAGYLRQLRDAHVPVLFRAYHEMNGSWFWWGGRPGNDGSAALYRQIYNRFVNLHHLDNLIWVWNVNAPGGNAARIEDYYPGPQYADLLTMDNYSEFKDKYYASMVALAGGKPIALGEVGTLPTPAVLERQPRWTYFMVWGEWIRTANTPDQAKALYDAPRSLNRDDPRLAGPMEAMRKATAERTGGKPDAEPVSPGATAEAKALLARLYAAPGKAVLGGQQNDPSSPLAATAAAIQATGKRPAIYGAELAVGEQPGSSADEARKAMVQHALHAHAKHSVVGLSWRPARPDGASGASARGQLTDYEWNQLLTPGSELNKRWCAQADEAAASLKELQDAGVAVLWNPYPESNGKDFWWAGRKGVHGSAELYRGLFDRLVNRNGLHNLVWVWEAAAPEPGQGSEVGRFGDYIPSLLYVDALEARMNRGDEHASRELALIAVGKPLGVELTGELPPPEALTGAPGWAWLLAAPPAPPEAAPRAEALRKLYADPHIVSVAPAK